MSNKKTKVKLELTRGDFLTIAGAAAGSVVVSQLVTTGPLSPFTELKREMISGEEFVEESAGHAYRWGMIVNLDTCIGCEYCLRACSATNDVNTDKPWNIVVKEQTSTGQQFFFSRPCLHCQDAPCVEVCPVRATYHREDGLVVMDYDRCIGCRYCEVACPYDARKFNWEARSEENPYIPTWGIGEVERRPRGVVEKCTFCVHRIDAGLASGLMPGEHPEGNPRVCQYLPGGSARFWQSK